MKAVFVVFHDDPPCNVRLVDGYCPECKFVPDMQSLSGRYYCPFCSVELKNLTCPICRSTYDKP